MYSYAYPAQYDCAACAKHAMIPLKSTEQHLLPVTFFLSKIGCGNFFQCAIVKLGNFLHDDGYETHSV